MSKLLVIGISGLAICAACLGGAAALGGKSLRTSLGNMGFDFADLDKPRCDISGKPGARTIAWSGGDSIVFALPADISYRPGTSDEMVATGDSALLAHLRIDKGTVKMDCRPAAFGHGIDIALSGHPFRSIALAGSGDLTLTDVDQADLKVRMAGSGDVRASGKTGDLDIKMVGSGDARLGDLAADRVSLDMAGSGDAEVAPKDELRIRAAGSGDVRLRSEPRSIDKHMAGSGDLIHMARP